MEQNNFSSMDDDNFENNHLFDDMHENIINRIDGARNIGNIFGNFFHQFSGFIIMILGGKPKK